MTISSMIFYRVIVKCFRKILKLDVMRIEVPTVCESSQMKQEVIDAMVIYLEQTIKHK